jgi:hypothetical protein
MKMQFDLDQAAVLLVESLYIAANQENEIQVVQYGVIESYADFWCTGKGGEKAYPAE